jgi:hypothetical protein
MANPIPCQACLEVADGEFFVTNRLAVPWPFEQSTVCLCVPCFIQTGISMGEALQAAMAELEKMANPEELAQIQANEAADATAHQAEKRSRKSKAAPQPEPVHAAVSEEAPASDE